MDQATRTLLEQLTAAVKVHAQKINQLELEQRQTRLNDVWITSDGRSRLRWPDAYTTEVLGELWRRGGAATTGYMRTAATYAAARLKELHNAKSLKKSLLDDQRAGGRIEQTPDRCWNKPTIRHTRISVVDVLEDIARGDSTVEIAQSFRIQTADVTAAVGYACAAIEDDETASQGARDIDA